MPLTKKKILEVLDSNWFRFICNQNRLQAQRRLGSGVAENVNYLLRFLALKRFASVRDRIYLEGVARRPALKRFTPLHEAPKTSLMVLWISFSVSSARSGERSGRQITSSREAPKRTQIHTILPREARNARQHIQFRRLKLLTFYFSRGAWDARKYAQPPRAMRKNIWESNKLPHPREA